MFPEGKANPQRALAFTQEPVRSQRGVDSPLGLNPSPKRPSFQLRVLRGVAFAKKGGKKVFRSAGDKGPPDERQRRKKRGVWSTLKKLNAKGGGEGTTSKGGPYGEPKKRTKGEKLE